VSSKLQAVDPNSEDIDSTTEIQTKFQGDKQGAEEYFTQKRDSIIRGYRNDSNSAAASDVKSDELEKWLNIKNSLLEQLALQKEDVMDDFPDSVTSPKDDSKNDDSKNEDSKQDNNQFKQDSSDIYPTDFSSSEPFDD